MDTDRSSRLLGEYFRFVVERKAEESAYAALHGTGKPIKNPFTGESMSYKAPKSLVLLAGELKKHKLDQDQAFVKVLSAAVADITADPIAYVLGELNAYQEHGDGGPDPSFELKLQNDQVADMKVVIESFKRGM